jgi:hypothetical protein
MKKITLLILMLCFFSWSCVPKKTAYELPDKASVAVVNFSQPAQSWQTINSQVPVGVKRIDIEVIEKLNSDLAALTAQSKHTVFGPQLLENCTQTVSHGTDPGSAFHYWVQVGRCLSADYILVPFVFDWQERKGGEWGVDEPAKVTLELNLIDLKELRLQSFFFEERQQSLSENILGLGRFFKRGAKWVSARALAREGLEKGLRNLGL